MKQFRVTFETKEDKYMFWHQIDIYGDNAAHVYQQFKKLAYTNKLLVYKQWTGKCGIREVDRESCN